MEAIAPGLAIIGVIGGGIGIGLIGKGRLDAISRNPDMQSTYFLAAIISIAFAEATAIFALVIAFMLL